ncbi:MULTISPECIES: DUF257 family protein [Thermococcus]|uniref:Uncharacterized protein n=1 Tax=Thermococcus nautili TaxID=195522 RepID=W8NVU2_9EURY|nr:MULTISPECIES: DUF257 family protein [Thermococcus]AHL23282.1 hypothetical protein BD01_1679 [Thermococcus nautili]NJE49920.1 biotin synthase [Thermococcus sp. 9N3]CAI1493081.1 conserved protein of unknown function [Thermococcus nautili]
MAIKNLEKDVLSFMTPGDVVLIEYQSREPIENLAWGELLPAINAGGVVVVDFFGMGEILLRKFMRRGDVDYSGVLELLKDLRVVRVGPGTVTYGEILEDVVPSYDPHTFLRSYHSIMSKISRLPQKPKYMVTFGLGHYIHFNPENAIKSILTAVSTIPAEDLVIINFVNADVIKRAHLAILEELSTAIVEVSGGEFKVYKDGGIGD